MPVPLVLRGPSMAPPPPGSRQQQAYDELFRRPQPQPQPQPAAHTHRPSPQPRPTGAHGAQYASSSQYSHPQQAQKLAPYPAPYAQFGQLSSSSSPQPPLPPGHPHHTAAPYAAYPQHHPGGHAHPQQQQHASARAGQYLTQAAGTVPHRGHTIANPGGGQYATLPHDRNPYVASQSSTGPAHASLSYSRSTGATPAAYPAAASSYPQQQQPTGSSAPYSSAQAYQKQHAHPYPPSIPSSPAPSYHSQQSATAAASQPNWSSGHYPHDHHDVHGGKLSLSPDLSRRPNSGSSTTGGGGLSARPGYAPTLSSGPPSASTSASLFSRTSTSSMSSLLPYASNNPDDHSAPSSSSGVSSLDVSPNPPTVPLPAPAQRPPSGASSMYSVGSASSSNTGGSSGGRGGGGGGASYGQPPRLPEINPTAHDDFFGDYYQPLPAGDSVTPTAANGDGTSYWTAKRMSSGGASIASVGARSVTPTISSAKQASKRYSPAMRAEDVEGYTPTAAYGETCPASHPPVAQRSR